MRLGFFRHGGTAVLTLTVVALLLAWLFGAIALSWPEVALGAVLFYLSEYAMHRFAFHAPPAPWALVRKLQHRLHYDHHAEPGRLDLLFLPLWFLTPNLVATAALIALVLGAQAVASVMLGVMGAILHYEWVHYVAHISYRPLTPIGRWMKQYHLRHHYVSEKEWFGVSNPSLDLLFGTFKTPGEVKKSGTTRKLYS